MLNRLFKFIVAAISLSIIFICTSVGASAEILDYTIPGGGDFHPPRLAAEQRPNTILKRNEDNPDIMNYLLSVPYRNTKKDKNYVELFTPSLRNAVSKAEAKEVKEKCGGTYTGDLCGLDFDPIICAQDIPDYYLYRTEYQSQDKVVITAGFARSLNDKDPYPAATYSLVKQGKDWRVDGILCQNWPGYNFTDTDKIKGLTAKPRGE